MVPHHQTAALWLALMLWSCGCCPLLQAQLAEREEALLEQCRTESETAAEELACGERVIAAMDAAHQAITGETNR